MAVQAAELRRTQAERSATMRARLLDATVECLVELGYAGTTTTEVVRRAGVSRGAQVHHFPTKQDLVVAAIGHVLDIRQEEFRRSFEALPREQRSLGAALDLIWSAFQGASFAAWLELAMAARTDADLRRHFLDLERGFTARNVELYTELFPTPPDAEFGRLGVDFAFALMNGLALQRHVGIGEHADDLFEMLKGLAAMFADDLGGTP